MSAASFSHAVQPGPFTAFRPSFAHVIATRPQYDIYVGGGRSHINDPSTYNTPRTFAGKPDCWVRPIDDIPSVGSLLVMRARDTKQFYIARVSGPPVETIVPCSPAHDVWGWSHRTPKHQRESRAEWAATRAAGLPAEDYILSIPVDGWRLVAEPTPAQKDSYGKVRRYTIQKMRTPWPDVSPSLSSTHTGVHPLSF
jgi:hypothetical protein